MRDEILTYLEANVLDGFTITRELPWNESGDTPLYMKNFKVVYANLPEVFQEELYDTLHSTAVVDETETVFVYVANDAKTLPTNYEGMVDVIKASTRYIGNGNIERLCQVDIEYFGSIVLTTFAISAKRAINNSLI
jgi:hypothetical protein